MAPPRRNVDDFFRIATVPVGAGAGVTERLSSKPRGHLDSDTVSVTGGTLDMPTGVHIG